MERNKISKTEYANIHQWIRSHYGKASKCENKKCVFKNPRRFEWALKKGKAYERNIKNFKQLCASCHRKYDITDEVRKNMSKASQNTKLKICIRGHKYSKENTLIITRTNGKKYRRCRICNNILRDKTEKKYKEKYRQINIEYLRKYRLRKKLETKIKSKYE